jgi:hypothetical protein
MSIKSFSKKINSLKKPEEIEHFVKSIESIDEIKKVNTKLNSLTLLAQTLKIITDIGDKESDIYIVSHAKSGTTLTQMLLYQLTTKGNMDFNHIYDVSPWPRHCAVYNIPFLAVNHPRLIKSHDPYWMFENVKNSKIIFLIRDGIDTLSSLHQHLVDYDNLSVDLSDFFNNSVESWFKYNSTWLKNEKNLNILYINYEDLVLKKEETINVISNFINIKPSAKTIKRTVERTSLKFMKLHEKKFGEQPDLNKTYNNFIRNGAIGVNKNLLQRDQLDMYKSMRNNYFEPNSITSRYFVD